LVKTITGVITGETKTARARGAAKAKQGVIQTEVTTGRTLVSGAVITVQTEETVPTGEDAATATTTDSN
jgi:hypothetical protein